MLVVILLMLLIALVFYLYDHGKKVKNRKKKRIIPENPKTIKIKVRSGQKHKKDVNMLFEEDDLKYYSRNKNINGGFKFKKAVKQTLNNILQNNNQNADQSLNRVINTPANIQRFSRENHQENPRRTDLQTIVPLINTTRFQQRLTTALENTQQRNIIGNIQRFPIRTQQINIGDLMHEDNRIFDTILEMDFTENDIRNMEAELFDVDSQNVHDTEVNKAVRKIFDGIQIKKCDKDKANDLIKKINGYIDTRERNGYIDNRERNGHIDSKKTEVNRVLEEIKRRNGHITNINANELDVLTTIWEEAEKKSGESCNNIKDMLITQISDTLDRGNVLCPTGFINRISTALVVESPEDFPKTKAMLDREMLESAAYIRSELEKDQTYNNLPDDKQSEQFKEKLMEKLEKDYEGIFTKDELEKNIEPWINHV